MSDQPQWGQAQGPDQQPWDPPPTGYGQPTGMQPSGSQPGYGPAPATNTLAIVALVLAFVFTPAGLVCGYIARNQIRRTGEGGRGLALAAIIIGWIWVAFIVLAIIGVVLLASVSSSP